MSQDWLQNLEVKIELATGRLRELCEENERLETRCGELESRVEELEAQVADAGDGDDGEWREEREDIRQRVEKLVDHLSELLAE